MSTVETSPSRTGRRRRATPPGFEESVQQGDGQQGDRPQAGRHQGERQQTGRPQAERTQADRPPTGRPRLPDPPIYLDLIARWTEAGRTLPGRRDPEWHRIASSPIWPSGPLYGG
ncbi:hypothetical protein ABZZ17_17470 [Streptomyces sp. NPDC006512]|uniref:hypothetical protein n=1 Tax=Streptomyces sp. NPDC006512 TaxID=3154307 RepID=UPI0033BAD108